MFIRVHRRLSLFFFRNLLEMIRETKLANRAEAVENSTVPRLPLASVMWIIAVGSVVALRAKHCRARNGGLCWEMRTQRDPPTGSRRKSFPWSGMVRGAKIAKWRAAPRLKQPQWPVSDGTGGPS